jgi:BirA family biotin operon repressor/biotin-[acetyl-CoA-carboxylase] ligase
LDSAHLLAEQGAPAGSLVIANAQRVGRGRGGRRWLSHAGNGIWMTLLERPNDLEALDVLSLRIGLRLARVLDRFCEHPVQLKWPNDLYANGGKLGGILVEARWRDGRPDWVAIGVGLNTHPNAEVPEAASLGTASRRTVLEDVLPAIRAAAAARGHLSVAELDEFAGRDLARERPAREPARGRVAGVAPNGDLLIRTATGVVACRTGSLVLEDVSA